MKIISNKTARKIIRLLTAIAKGVHLNSFDGSHEEQIAQFDKFTKDVTDIVYALGGMSGLAFLEGKLGISSNPEFTKEECK